MYTSLSLSYVCVHEYMFICVMSKYFCVYNLSPHFLKASFMQVFRKCVYFGNNGNNYSIIYCLEKMYN